jgi:N-acetylmuramoyl-L-alanine amidase CwlA
MNIMWKGSPNYTKRTKKIKKIIIHWFGLGTLESANARFQKKENQVSAHYGVSKGRIWQWVHEENVAFHAGVYSVNQESIGIEHDATLNGHDLSDVDYLNSGKLIADISKRHNIPLDRKHVLKHSEVKATQCCGTVDVDRLIAIAKNINNLNNDERMIIKEKRKSALYAVVGDVLIPFSNYESYIADFKDAKIIEVDSAEIAKFKKSTANLIKPNN